MWKEMAPSIRKGKQRIIPGSIHGSVQRCRCIKEFCENTANVLWKGEWKMNNRIHESAPLFGILSEMWDIIIYLIIPIIHLKHYLADNSTVVKWYVLETWQILLETNNHWP